MKVTASHFIGSSIDYDYYLIKTSSTIDRDRLIGSTFTLKYDDGVFSFTNFHTPIMGESLDSGSTTVYTNPSILYLFARSGSGQDNTFQVVDSYGGFDDAVFQSQSDASKQFDYINNHRVHPRVITADFRSSTSVGNYWIRKIWKEENLEDGGNIYSPVNGYNYQLVESDDTYALSGNENFIVDNSGYYRIEVVAQFTNDFKMEDSRLGAVIGVVSKNYNANDFITGYGADSGISSSMD